MKFKTRRQSQEDSKSRIEDIEITIEQQTSIENQRGRNPNVFEFSNSVVDALEEMSGFQENVRGVRPLRAEDFMRLIGGKREMTLNQRRIRQYFTQIFKSSLKEYQGDQVQMIRIIRDNIVTNIQQKLLDQQTNSQYTNLHSLQTTNKISMQNIFQSQQSINKSLKHQIQTNNQQKNIQQAYQK